jgi:hypothetical protein
MSSFEQKKVLLGTYFGSDFNYANSRPFRKSFANNTQDKDLLDIGFLADQKFLKKKNSNPTNPDDGANQHSSDEQVEVAEVVNHGLGLDEKAYLEFVFNL